MSKRIATNKATKPSYNPQNFNTCAWYYENRRWIEVYHAPSPEEDGEMIGRISHQKLAASLERMGYTVTKKSRKP